MTWRARLLVLLPLLLLGFGARASACSCRFRTEAQHLEASVAAFDAVVIEVRRPQLGTNPERARLEVVRKLKGPHAEGSIVRFETVTATCGLSVRPGQRWRVFVSGKEPYALSMCSGSHPLGATRERTRAE